MASLDTPQRFRLAVDVVQRRPACVILQAVFGGDRYIVGRYFNARTWLVAPTDDMRMVEGTIENWKMFADEANARVTG